MMLMNLLVGLPTMLICLVLQASLTFRAVRFYINQVHNNPTPGWLGRGVGPLLVVMVLLMLGNFIQIMIWGLLFLGLGQFEQIYEAVYHSGVNFTSLGYGDIVMQQQWKMLGPLEAANGVLMFGMTGATLMTVLQVMIKNNIKSNLVKN